MKQSILVAKLAAILESAQQHADKDLSALFVELKAEETPVPTPPAPTPVPTPPAPTPVPTPPAPQPGARIGLYVNGQRLYTKGGQEVQWRGMELMWGPSADSNPAKLIGNIKSFGANAISPLFQAGQNSVADLRECLLAARSLGMLVGVNADHTGGGTEWICSAPIVAECRQYDNIILESEVELGSIDTMTQTQWLAAAKAFVKRLRDAGHTAPIKVGSPSGGRSPKYALAVGQELVASDPLRSLMFTWQAYWKASTQNWQYASENGMASPGTAGALEMVEAIRRSGLCFLTGLDGADDVGPTPWQELAAALHIAGQGWQWWAWMVGDSYGNGVVSDTMGTQAKQPFGPALQSIMRAQSKLVTL